MLGSSRHPPFTSTDVTDEGSTPPAHGEQLHRLLLSLFASGEAFRQWVSLGPHGEDLVAELPERPASTSAALFAGIEVLRRHGCVDRAFFARLARDFPRRNGDITRVGGTLGANASDHPCEASADRRGRRRLWILAALGLAVPGGYLVRDRFTPEPVLPRSGESEPGAEVDREAPRLYSTIPDALPARGSERRALRQPTPGAGPRVTQAVEPRLPVRQELPTLTAATPSRCELSPNLETELHALSHTSLSGPAITERFTVILRGHASRAEVSPRPSPGQVSRERLYTRLLALGPAELGRCRDVPVDVSFSWGRTAMAPRSI